jgi:hypothetical protein
MFRTLQKKHQKCGVLMGQFGFLENENLREGCNCYAALGKNFVKRIIFRTAPDCSI